MSDKIKVTDVIGNTDAVLWTKFWLQSLADKPDIATDESTMIGWFANAIMAGVDATEMKYMLHNAGVDTVEGYVDKVLLNNG